MSTPDEQRELWRIGDVRCLLVSCCSGAELQLWRGDQITLRELYPSKSDLYERAESLRQEKTGESRNATRRD